MTKHIVSHDHNPQDKPASPEEVAKLAETSKSLDSASEKTPSADNAKLSWRSAIQPLLEQVLKNHPGLTEEKALEMLEAYGA